jgi:hypothetical protein
LESVSCVATDCITGPVGLLSIKVIDSSGNIVTESTDQNMIMTSSKSVLANLIAGDGTGKVITNIAFGNSDSLPSPDNTTIGSITSTDLVTGLNTVDDQACAFLKAVSDHTYPSDGRVTFSWILDYGEANGLEIREYGLVCSDLTLFSRKTRNVITKDSDLYIEGEWTIIF